QIGIDLSGEIIAEAGKVNDAVDAVEEPRIEMPSVPHDEFEQWAGREIAEFFLPEEVAVESEHMVTARHEIAAQWNADIAACTRHQYTRHRFPDCWLFRQTRYPRRWTLRLRRR